ncbi:hypothetical protein COOONC_07263 [Cooperia oncophora]
MDKRGSTTASYIPVFTLAFRDARSHEFPAHHNILSSRNSVAGALGRRSSKMDGTISSLLPNFQHHRKSIAVGTLGRRASFMEGAGEILPGSSVAAHRRPSTAATASGPSFRRLSVQPNDDAVHLIVNRRRSSAHPKHFLL